ncbi:hypothetical protein DID97_05680 [Burkholderia sp. Bp8977]|nr:hypothetical protein DIE09_06200 [Burkholderia sp. Bp9010]RQS80699.1 hypothetical protein DID97_05680 [Burkholderia sp. Bp8977]
MIFDAAVFTLLPELEGIAGIPLVSPDAAAPASCAGGWPFLIQSGSAASSAAVIGAASAVGLVLLGAALMSLMLLSVGAAD